MTHADDKANGLIAHVAADSDGNWLPPQALDDHLNNVSTLTRVFASEFQSGDFGALLGYAHDLGKSTHAWQKYLRDKTGYPNSSASVRSPGRVEHSIQGAKFVEGLLGKRLGHLLGFPIAGHHAGLPDWQNPDAPAGTLEDRLLAADISDLSQETCERVRALRIFSSLPALFGEGGLSASVWIRMLFSCLVDADRLDSEKYDAPEKSATRTGYADVPELRARFDSYMASVLAGSVPSPVNVIRKGILDRCLDAANGPRGVYSLTVPTGGGKTLSSLGFALNHACKYDLRRIIYVIPYTSIIEQNAKVFKAALGTDQVVEHHSNVVDESGRRPNGKASAIEEQEHSDESLSVAAARRRLAAENWDAPVVVTTNVQFFESLFSSSPSRSRKLHNIVNSVVILDEAQLVAPEHIDPILETLGILVRNYGVTLVISTATQPAFGQREQFKGLGNIQIHEIVDDVPALFASMKRTVFDLPDVDTPPLPWKDLATELECEDQVLCVVSDRRSCRELHSLMPKGTFHLSALMCPEHRSERLNEIKGRLSRGESVRVVSTQLVEAGVDLDFPVVYRALAGLDSIVQAAGRCNREGKLGRPGRVKVFVPERKPPVGLLRKASDTTRELMSIGAVDPSEPGLFNRYFESLYWRLNSRDRSGLLSLLSPNQDGLRFRSAVLEMIGNNQVPIAVPYGRGELILARIHKKGFPDRNDLRELQRFIVTVSPDEFQVLRQRDSVDEVVEGLWRLCNEMEYSDEVGLLVREISSDVNGFMLS